MRVRYPFTHGSKRATSSCDRPMRSVHDRSAAPHVPRAKNGSARQHLAQRARVRARRRPTPVPRVDASRAGCGSRKAHDGSVRRMTPMSLWNKRQRRRARARRRCECLVRCVDLRGCCGSGGLCFRKVHECIEGDWVMDRDFAEHLAIQEAASALDAVDEE